VATAGDGPGAGPERAFARPLPDAGRVRLDAEESAHLVRVRRVAPGEPVVLFDGEGATRVGRLVVASPRGAEVEVLGPYPDREPRRRVVVAASPPEGGRADDLVATLAEMGVTTFVPTRCHRTPAGRIEGATRRAARWARRIREAAKVSGRSRFLAVRPPTDLASLLAERATPGVVLLDPDPGAPALADLLPASGDAPVLCVGPEGGFTAEERDLAARTGARTARLLAAALRVETAAVVAAALALASEPG
jgi:16S rRNA (uracil1498-N3)-methyltransferase